MLFIGFSFYLKGFRVVPAQDCWHKSLEPLMAEVRDQMGNGPVYISFDIDGLDPAYAPGTGNRYCVPYCAVFIEYTMITE